MKFKRAIIDGDPLIYSCGFAIEELIDGKAELKEGQGLQHAQWNIDSVIRNTIKDTEAESYSVWLTPPLIENFRIKIDPKYKCNRKDARRPLLYKEIKDYLILKHGAKITKGQEADDACSIEQCSINKDFFDPCIEESILCSIDKDFNNTPGYHYNTRTKDLYYVTEIQALRNFYLQILTGDISDSIPRIKKGWKKKNSVDLINKAENEKELIDIVKEEIYTIYNKDIKEEETFSMLDAEQVMINRGRLVWMRRKENELWLPPILEKTGE